jgi:pseudoazurin
MLFRNLIALILTFSIGTVMAKDHQVKMLNGKAPDMFVFEPAVIIIQKGDTVTWSGDAMHNSASIKEMLPKGAASWEGKLTKEAGEVSISVKFETEGVYGYKCTPHEMFGMVGLVVVGDPSSNLSDVTSEGKKIEGKFAVGKGRFSQYLSQIK